MWKRWPAKCPTCGNEIGLRQIRELSPEVRVYGCSATLAHPYPNGQQSRCTTEFRVVRSKGLIEDLIEELNKRVDGFRM